MLPQSRPFFLISVTSFVALIILLIAWIGWWQPPRQAPRALFLLVFVGPLMLFLRGLLNANYQRHLWGILLALIYACGAFLLALTPGQALPGSLMLALTLGWFGGSFIYMRTIVKASKAAKQAKSPE